ncbi:WW domain-binding protein 4 [Madurella mycetomatis]|uniref:WW domain-binding protein 4 n=1 Tax=Madurella mycetomatis TaxID=100816 RepID=A0A175WH75_9PEZI|nr:WW domain-binding protein 4 [Madurella mycetomatis]
MSEYWKSTPKYWCKHCSVYVRDTKLERANHEATAKHQGAIKRSLRDLHRDAEQKEREKERAKREVERLNGVVSGAGSSASAGTRSGTKPSGGGYSAAPQQVTQAERQKQLEQLAELGVNIPTELRGNMAMAGEWTVTSTRVVQDTHQNAGDTELASNDARATGVKRERERTEEEKEQEEAIKGLFKKPRKWGIDSKTMPAEEDAELDALLSGPLVKTKKEDSEHPHIKTEESQEEWAEDGDAVKLTKSEPSPPIKKEADEEEAVADIGEKKETVPDLPSGTGAANESSGAAIMFKKRKPKNLRQR